MVKSSYIDENGLKKGAWSPEEDEKLRGYIMRYGHWNWRELPKYAGLARCGKSCRLRWINYLQPNVKHGAYTKDEEELIIKLHDQLGNKWSTIARNLPGRTDNEIKNYWHTHLKKRMREQQPKTKREQNKKLNKNPLSKVIQSHRKIHHPIQILESSPISPSLSEKLPVSSSVSDSDVGSNSDEVFGDHWLDDSFWKEPFMLDYSQNQDMEFDFLDQVMLSPYMSYVESMDFMSIFNE